MWTKLYRILDGSLKVIRGLVLVSVVGLACGGGYYLLSHPAPAKSWIESALNGEDGVRTRISDFRMAEKSGNDDRWTLSAQSVSVTADTTDMDDVKMHFVHPAQKNHEAVFDLTSHRAVMDNATKNITFSGEVWLKMPKPATLHTEKLDWKSAERQIFTDGNIKLETETGVVNGKGLSIDLNRQSFTVNSSVRASFY